MLKNIILVGVVVLMAVFVVGSVVIAEEEREHRK